MTEKLKPCPCCGSDDIYGYPSTGEIGKLVIFCRKCSLGVAAEGALQIWNRRVTEKVAPKAETYQELLDFVKGIRHLRGAG